MSNRLGPSPTLEQVWSEVWAVRELLDSNEGTPEDELAYCERARDLWVPVVNLYRDQPDLVLVVGELLYDASGALSGYATQRTRPRSPAS